MSLVLCLTLGTSGAPVQAQTSSPRTVVPDTPVPPAAVPPPYIDYSSKHFLVHTDLPREEALALVERLEATLGVVAVYWDRPSRRVIECYVVHDLAQWPDSALPHPLARILVGGVGGGTIGTPEQNGGRTTLKAQVYASTQPGIAEHETVHAYCTQAFGAAGPDWYKEGMAELAYYGRERRDGVGCPQVVIDGLRQGQLRSLNDIVNRGRFTGALAKSVDDLLSRNERTEGAGTQVPLALWTAEHGDVVKEARQAYHWSWALCHMLCHNPNYASRFRALGRAYLTSHPSTFEQHFGAVAREISFEYRFFVKHIDVGYRVDLCAWDWKTRFREFDRHDARSARVHANRGYQASGLLLSKGRRYRFRGTGQWTTAPDRPASSASGDAEGRGKLVGAVMHEHELGDWFELGAEGQFTAAGDGKLYLRCEDAWNELADNEGAVTVRFERAVD